MIVTTFVESTEYIIQERNLLNKNARKVIAQLSYLLSSPDRINNIIFLPTKSIIHMIFTDRSEMRKCCGFFVTHPHAHKFRITRNACQMKCMDIIISPRAPEASLRHARTPELYVFMLRPR